MVVGTSNIRKVVAKNIRAIRERNGWAQTELAKRAKVTARYISIMETGKRNPSIETLDHIATALGVSVCQLVCDQSTSNSKAKEAMRLAIAVLERHSSELSTSDV